MKQKSQKIIWLGYVTVMVFLITPIVVISYVYLSQFAQRMETLVDEVNVKTALSFEMYSTSRERSVILLRMIHTDDPFELDELRAEMSLIANKFISARDSLLAMPLSKEETAAIVDQQQKVSIAAPVQNNLADRLLSGPTPALKEEVFDVAIPLQTQVMNSLDRLIKIQKKTADTELMKVKNLRDQTILIIAILSVTAFLVSLVVVIFVSRRISLYESQQTNINQKMEESVALAQEAWEEAQSANMAKSRFLANMSHELRTPMHAILSFTDLALKKNPNPKQERYLNNIKTSAGRLQNLLNNLLDLSELETGRITPDEGNHSLGMLVEESINSLGKLISEKQLAIHAEFSEDTEATFDRKLIGQVVFNLLSNAIRFSEVGGEVSLLVDKFRKGSHQRIRLCVIDHGIGIPENELETVFDKFTQSSKTMSQAGGTGLGLAICKEIVAAHKGKIWAESPVRLKGSNQTDSGSAFYVEFDTSV